MIFRTFFSFHSVDGLPSTNLTYPTKRCNGEKHRLKSVFQNNRSDLCHFPEVLPFLKLMQYLQLNGWKYRSRNMSFPDSHLFRCFFVVVLLLQWKLLHPLEWLEEPALCLEDTFFPYLGTALRLWFFSNVLSLSLSLNPKKKYLLVVCWPQAFKDMFPQQNKQHKTLNMMKFLPFIWYRFCEDPFECKDTSWILWGFCNNP